MTDDLLTLLNSDAAPDDLLADLMPALGEALACDRCVLFLRDPHSGRSRATHAWQCKPEYALAREDKGWREEPPSLVEDDPMFAEALRNPVALFIEDIETADPALVNRDYEREHFQHRALVHAPLYHEGLMYGILEPCVMAAPRVWSAADRELIASVQAKIAPAAAAYVARHRG
jgi:GAF domain-containing protein